MVGTSMSTAGQVHAEEIAIVRLAVALGALKVGGPLSAEEKRLATKALTLAKPTRVEIRQAREAIGAPCDPLGDRIIAARSQPDRRILGQVFTPSSIVAPMVEWVLDQSPSRVRCRPARAGVPGPAVAPYGASSRLALAPTPGPIRGSRRNTRVVPSA